jgi:hypothetical protein
MDSQVDMVFEVEIASLTERAPGRILGDLHVGDEETA